MAWLGTTHLGVAILALVSGLGVILTKKGTPGHRRLGWLYAGSMAGVIVTALMIYDLFGGFGPFHVAAIVSGITVVAGVIPALRRKPRRMWIAHHAYWMTWSYVGLTAAAAAEVSTRLLRIDFGLAVALATLVVVACGWWLIRRRMPRILRRFGIEVEATRADPAEA